MSFTSLPHDIRREVYARMHVVDRFSFNRALPVGERIERVPMLDKHLAVLWHLFRHGRVLSASVPSSVMQFMCTHSEDPTVASIVAEYGVVLPVPSTPTAQNDVNVFMHRFRCGTATEADVARLADDVIESSRFVTELLDAFNERLTPAAYKLIANDARISAALARSYNLWSDGALISGTLHKWTPEAVAMRAFLCTRKDDYFVRLGFEHLRQPTYARIYALNVACVEFMLRECDLPPDTKHALLNVGIKRFDVDIIVMVEDSLR